MLHVFIMRTTLTIDDNVASAVERFKKKQKMSTKDSINYLLRIGLQAAEKKTESKPYSGQVFHSVLQAGIDPLRLNQLADELEAEGFTGR